MLVLFAFETMDSTSNLNDSVSNMECDHRILRSYDFSFYLMESGSERLCFSGFVFICTKKKTHVFLQEKHFFSLSLNFFNIMLEIRLSFS